MYGCLGEIGTAGDSGQVKMVHRFKIIFKSIDIIVFHFKKGEL